MTTVTLMVLDAVQTCFDWQADGEGVGYRAALAENNKDPIPEIFPKTQQSAPTLFLKNGKSSEAT